MKAGVTDQYESYFPAGIWVNLNDYSDIIDNSAGGKVVNLTTRNEVNAHLRSGTILPYQDDTYKSVDELLHEYITLVINRDTSGVAKGTLLLDEGISRAEIYNN